MTDWFGTAVGADAANHKTRHQDGGADEISVVGLSGLLADDQHVLDAEVTSVAVARALFDAHTVLIAISDDTPVALTVGEQSVVGRITGGNIVALTGAQLWTILTGQAGADVTINKQVKVGAGAGAGWAGRTWANFSLEVTTGVGFVSNILMWEATKGGEFIFATNPESAPTWHLDNDTGGTEGAIGSAFRIFRQPTVAGSGLLYLTFSPTESALYTPNAAGTAAVERLNISGTLATAVATWSNVTHTGIVLSGALDANSQTISNVVSITGATGINLMPSGDTDDYITFTTAGNLPRITATGAAYLEMGSIVNFLSDIYLTGNVVGVTGTVNINAQNADASTIIFGGRDTGVGIVEVGRILGAADPEFKLGNNGNALRASYAGSLGFFGTAPQAKIVDARIDDAINSGDATTDGVIDAIRDALITYGLIAAA